MHRRHHFMSFPTHSKEEMIEQMYRGLSRDITIASALGRTSYIYEPHFAPGSTLSTDDLVRGFQDKFPHFSIRAEKKGILIDWS
jgi:hypothetical protein